VLDLFQHPIEAKCGDLSRRRNAAGQTVTTSWPLPSLGQS